MFRNLILILVAAIVGWALIVLPTQFLILRPLMDDESSTVIAALLGLVVGFGSALYAIDRWGDL